MYLLTNKGILRKQNKNRIQEIDVDTLHRSNPQTPFKFAHGSRNVLYNKKIQPFITHCFRSSGLFISSLSAWSNSSPAFQDAHTLGDCRWQSLNFPHLPCSEGRESKEEEVGTQVDTLEGVLQVSLCGCISGQHCLWQLQPECWEQSNSNCFPPSWGSSHGF